MSNRLTPAERELVEALRAEDGAWVEKSQLADRIFVMPESIHVLVFNIRAKIGHEVIASRRNSGYRWTAGQKCHECGQPLPSATQQ